MPCSMASVDWLTVRSNLELSLCRWNVLALVKIVFHFLIYFIGHSNWVKREERAEREKMNKMKNLKCSSSLDFFFFHFISHFILPTIADRIQRCERIGTELTQYHDLRQVESVWFWFISFISSTIFRIFFLFPILRVLQFVCSLAGSFVRSAASCEHFILLFVECYLNINCLVESKNF